jgi:DNA-directed RNA polymerase subunit N (RpoN/RPB10)
MPFPICCFSCNFRVGSLYEKYCEEISNGMSNKEFFDKYKIKRICCKRMFLSHVDKDDEILSFSNDIVLNEKKQ